jgi:hypothetical protein
MPSARQSPGPSATCRTDETVRDAGRRIGDDQIEPGPGEMPGHREAHIAEADEADRSNIRHCALLSLSGPGATCRPQRPRLRNVFAQ